MAVLGWIIFVLFGAAYLFGPPILFGGGGVGYLKALGAWIALLAVAAVVVLLLLFAVNAVFGISGG